MLALIATLTPNRTYISSQLSRGSTCRRIRYRRFSQPGGLWANYLICATRGYLVYSSLACTGLGALVGVGVLAACTLGLALTKGGF